MKTKLVLILMLGIGSYHVALAQQVSRKEVPQAVIKSYMSQNSAGGADSLWSKQISTMYKVNYMDDGRKYEAQYFEDGRWIKTFTEITQAELPSVINKQVAEMHPGFAITKAYIELNNDGKFYAIDIARGSDKLTIYFLMSGKFVK